MADLEKVEDLQSLNGLDNNKIKVGSHQAQHLIPKSKTEHPVIALTGYQVDHYENGIMALNMNAKEEQINSLKNFLEANKDVISDNNIKKYVTDKTHHGFNSTGFKGENLDNFHQAYSDYVSKRLDAIAEKHGIQNWNANNFKSKLLTEKGIVYDVNTFAATDFCKELRKDVFDLNRELRQKHIDGIDLYYKNDGNIYIKDYYEYNNNLLTEEKANERYLERNFSCGNK